MVTKLPTRTLGRDGPQVSAIGYGCMGLDAFYGTVPPLEEKLKVLDKCYELGCHFWDSAALYQDSELTVGEWITRNKEKRKDIFIASKFLFPDDFKVSDDWKRAQDEVDSYIQAAVDKALSRLKIDKIDLYYLHRMHSAVPIERVIKAFVKLREQGKIQYFGLSECSADTLRRACKVSHVAAAQMEYSPFVLDVESSKTKFLETCRELGVALVAYSPLGRGVFAERFKDKKDLDSNDVRITGHLPYIEGEALETNRKLVDEFKAVAGKKGVKTGQVTLAWLLAQGEDIIPIPGTKRIHYLEENVASVNVSLSQDELEELRKAANSHTAVGKRYAIMEQCFMDTPEIGEEEKKALGL